MPSRKTPPRIKQEVDRTIRSRDMAIWNAKFDDLINDVTRSGSKICEEELFFLGSGPSCYNISLFRRKLPENKHFEKNAW